LHNDINKTMNTIESLQWRYATKKFDASKVLSNEKLEILKQAFNLTATSFGLQTIKLLIIQNKELRSELVAPSYYQKQVLDASHLLVFCVQTDVLDSDVDAHFDNVTFIRETPETILAPYRADLKRMMQSMTQQERIDWSIKQAYIALGNMMTVCAVEQIDACPMEGFDREQIDYILNLKDMNLKSVLLLPVGYRAEDDIFANFKKVRKQVSDAVLEL
jgi:nitroreductase / dihydropteridine reductase